MFGSLRSSIEALDEATEFFTETISGEALKEVTNVGGLEVISKMEVFEEVCRFEIFGKGGTMEEFCKISVEGVSSLARLYLRFIFKFRNLPSEKEDQHINKIKINIKIFKIFSI